VSAECRQTDLFLLPGAFFVRPDPSSDFKAHCALGFDVVHLVALACKLCCCEVKRAWQVCASRGPSPSPSPSPRALQVSQEQQDAVLAKSLGLSVPCMCSCTAFFFLFLLYHCPASRRWGNNGGRKWRGGRGPSASINFVTAHDGFTLADLVSYNEKHNEANGEENRRANSWAVYGDAR
jgi:hypothetical protein